MENEDENDDIHGNSKESKKLQHLYAIIDKYLASIFKFGISGEKLKKNNSSSRATSQTNKLNKKVGFVRYIAKIIKKNIEGRKTALDIENMFIIKYRKKHGDNPDGNIKPKPKK